MRTPRSAEERRALFLLAPATFFQGYDDTIVSIALPLIVADFHLSLAEAGVMVSALNLGSFGVLALLPLADRLGRKPILAVTILGYATATFATAFAPGAVGFAGAQFVAKAFLGTEFALAMTVLVELLHRERRGRGLGLVSSMSAFGQAGAGVGFLVVRVLGASWRWLYLVGVVPLLLVARARRDLPETLPRPAERRPRLREILAGVHRPWLVATAVLVFLFSVYPTAVTAFATLLVLDDWHWSLRAVLPLVPLWVLGVTGYFVAGRGLDALGRKPTTVAFTAGAAIAGVVTFTAATRPLQAVGLAFVIFGITGTAPCVAAFANEPFPSGVRGHVNGLLRLAGIGGTVVAPTLVGALSGPLGGLGPALAVAGLSYACAAAVVLLLLPETGRGFVAAAPDPASGS